MHQEFRGCELDDLGALRLRGVDVVRFLQGQLSSDVLRLAPGRSLLAGYHNPQGRVIALLRLVQLAEGDVLALLPRELAGVVAQRLGKFVLRSKVTITDDSAHWRIGGLACERSAEAAALPLSVGAQRCVGGTTVVCVGEQPGRWLEISPHTERGQPKGTDPAASNGLEISPHTERGQPELPPASPVSRERWRELDIHAGLPQVYAATSEQFVAQMLNLDAIGAIDFDKGCYTGQEVIARAHYRGRVKRRLQRFRSREPLELTPGNNGCLPDGRSFTVIEAVRLADGRCEFLAVARLPGAEPESAGGPGAGKPTDVELLELPYPLPA